MSIDREDRDAWRSLVNAAIAHDAAAQAALLEAVTPVVRVRVARVLARRGGRGCVDVDDLVQETFAHLFVDNARALRAWDPARGLPFVGFVGLLAERAARMAMRARKRDPWFEQPTDDDTLSQLRDGATASAQIEARDELRRLLALAEQRLTVAGCRYLHWHIEGRSVTAIASQTGTSADAVYTWRTRIKRLLSELRVELNADSA